MSYPKKSKIKTNTALIQQTQRYQRANLEIHQIQYMELKRQIPNFGDRGIRDLNEAYAVICWNYCRRMNNYGLCHQECAACHEHLDAMTHLERAQSWKGLLIYLARDEAAKAQDYASDHKQPIQTLDIGNLFETLANSMEAKFEE